MKRDTDLVIIGLLVTLIVLVLRKDKEPISKVSQVSRGYEYRNEFGPKEELKSDCPYCEWYTQASRESKANYSRSVANHIRQMHTKAQYEKFRGLTD